MKLDLVENVIKDLDSFIAKETDTLPFSNENGFIPIEIKKENFHELDLFSKDTALTAIDGGNANILKAANFSVDFIRIAEVSYKGRKRIDAIKKEFFLFVKAVNEKDKTTYSCDIIGDDLFPEGLTFSDIIETIDGEKYNLELSSIAGFVRRYAELKLSGNLSLNEGIVVVDGSIKAKTKEELELIKKIKGNFCFLSKTSRLLTKKGGSLNSALNEFGPKSSWYYHPVFKISNPDYLGEMYFVKLNSRSQYVFKLELGKDSNADDIILSLSMNSDDPIFYGYPYCLIEADKLARVENKEVDYLRTLFLSKIKNKEKLKYLLSNLDAHDILDKISY